MSAKIFVSYSRREELKPFVSKLKHDLESRGVSVWLDIKDIPAGADRYSLTGNAFFGCKCLIAVLSNCYMSSRYCKSELYAAADSDDKHIVPVIFESINYQLDNAMGVKYIISGLEQMHFIPNMDDYSFSLDKLVCTLGQYGVAEDHTDGGSTQGCSSGKTDLSTQMAGMRVSDEVVPSAPNYPPPDYNTIYPTQPSPPPPPVAIVPVVEPVNRPIGLVGNPFQPGMKLEANDRRFPYFVCVATIEVVRGNAVQIHFDGWGPEYDYWCLYDQIELHPVGWCARNGYELQPPRGRSFPNWNEYLAVNAAKPCDESMFNSIQTSPPGSLHFRVGMKLEAKDRQYPTLTCVASIADINSSGDLLIHFDGWNNSYDYWCKPNTTDIHPPMWCGKTGRKVQAPNKYVGKFAWNTYLAKPSGTNPAPAHVFTPQQLAK